MVVLTTAVVKRGRGGGKKKGKNQTTNHGLLHLSSTCPMAWKACLQCIVPEVPLSPVALRTVQPVGLARLPARPLLAGAGSGAAPVPQTRG